MDYREIISNAFNKKRDANPRYSLRAFARDIGLSPSRLSEIMTGKGDLSRDKAETIARKLSLPAMAALDFLDRVDSRSAPSAAQRQRAASRIEKRQRSLKNSRKYLDDAHFAQIFDPKFHIVWNFMQLPAFDGNPETILRYVKINSIELYDVLRALERQALAKKDGSVWIASGGQIAAGNHLPSEVIRAYHRKMADMGKAAIDGQQPNERHLHSVIIPFESSRFGEMQQKITAFSLELNDEFGSPAEADTVYGMALQFFKIVGRESLSK